MKAVRDDIDVITNTITMSNKSSFDDGFLQGTTKKKRNVALFDGSGTNTPVKNDEQQPISFPRSKQPSSEDSEAEDEPLTERFCKDDDESDPYAEENESVKDVDLRTINVRLANSKKESIIRKLNTIKSNQKFAPAAEPKKSERKKIPKILIKNVQMDQ